MINVYVNSVLKNIDIEQGCRISTTAAHQTSSKIKIRVANNVSINEFDYIQIYDDDTLILAGIVMNRVQVNRGYSTLTEKIFNIDVASVSDLIASKFCDSAFASGSTIEEILDGGILNAIEEEGITIGTVDTFDDAVLQEPANLWGMYITDVLDKLCDTAGAYWEITPAKVFDMRFTTDRDDAPFVLTETANAYDLSVQYDAFMLYSAVRVVGGNDEEGNPVIARVVDKDIAAEIATKRGGTGIVETLVTDNSIIDQDDAIAAAQAYLDANKYKSQTLKFKTDTAGFAVGQIMSDCEYDYYGISGDYVITAVTAVVTTQNDDTVIKYEIEAGTTPYRDSLMMLNAGRLAKFTIGSDALYPMLKTYSTVEAGFRYYYPSSTLYPSTTLYPSSEPILSLSDSGGEYFRKGPYKIIYNADNDATFIFYIYNYEGNGDITAIKLYYKGATVTLGTGTLIESKTETEEKTTAKYLQVTWTLKTS